MKKGKGETEGRERQRQKKMLLYLNDLNKEIKSWRISRILGRVGFKEQKQARTKSGNKSRFNEAMFIAVKLSIGVLKC